MNRQLASNESADIGTETGMAVMPGTRTTTPSKYKGTGKEQLLKKTANRPYTESSTNVVEGSSLQQQQPTGYPVLMGKIFGANKELTEETIFPREAEIPQYGVLTEHEMELEKVGY